MLNRLGQSLPPMLASDRVRGARLKKLGLFTTTSTMGVLLFIPCSHLGDYGGREELVAPRGVSLDLRRVFLRQRGSI